MTVYAYYTPFVSSPINDRRAGTYRVGSDSPNPIQIYRGWDTVMHFAFRTFRAQPYPTIGRTLTGRVFSTENVEILSKTLIPDPLVDGVASLVLNSSQTELIQPSLYSLILEVEDEFGRTTIAQTNTRGLPRFVVEVVDQTTIALNE
mgnify:CR=1 FL=1